jgi:hypothetical protein
MYNSTNMHLQPFDPGEVAELVQLWQQMSPAARAAVISVGKAMAKVEEVSEAKRPSVSARKPKKT